MRGIADDEAKVSGDTRPRQRKDSAENHLQDFDFLTRVIRFARRERYANRDAISPISSHPLISLPPASIGGIPASRWG